MVTAEQIRDLVNEAIEPTKPLAVLEFLKRFEGKAITTRIEAAVNKEFPEEDFRMVRAYGMTQLENGAYRNLQYSPTRQKDWRNWKGGIAILLAHSEAAVPFDSKYLTEHNTQYTKGMPERNAKRAASLKHAERLASAINAFHAAAFELGEAMKPFDADQYWIQDELVKREK